MEKAGRRTVNWTFQQKTHEPYGFSGFYVSLIEKIFSKILRKNFLCTSSHHRIINFPTFLALLNELCHQNPKKKFSYRQKFFTPHVHKLKKERKEMKKIQGEMHRN